jgi:hypothetical protein
MEDLNETLRDIDAADERFLTLAMFDVVFKLVTISCVMVFVHTLFSLLWTPHSLFEILFYSLNSIVIYYVIEYILYKRMCLFSKGFRKYFVEYCVWKDGVEKQIKAHKEQMLEDNKKQL